MKLNPGKFVNQIFSISFLLLFVIISGCSDRRSKKEEPKEEVTIESLEQFSPNVKLYFECSGSMDGYVGPSVSDFKKTIRSLIGEYNDSYRDSLEIFLIAEKIEKNTLTKDVLNFTDKLKQGDFKAPSSRMEDMIRMILESTDNNTVSVLVTDGIFSIGGETNATTGLNTVESALKDALYKKTTEFKKDNIELSVLIYQLESPFEGTYYKRYGPPGNKTEIHGGKRPYYVIYLGAKNQLDSIRKLEDRCFSIGSGLKNVVEFNSKDYCGLFDVSDNSNIKREEAYWSVLSSTAKKGSFRPIKIKGGDRILKIEGVKASRRESDTTFQFAMVMDLSSLPVNNEYKTSLNNYEVDSNAGYFLDGIIPIEDYHGLKPSDLKMIKSKDGQFKGSHVFIIYSKLKSFPDINIKMKRAIPVSLSSSYGGVSEDDDVLGNMNKTFGLEYLIRGFDDGLNKYRTNPKYYFNITIPVSAGPPPGGRWLIWLAILIILGGIVLIYLKNKRR